MGKVLRALPLTVAVAAIGWIAAGCNTSGCTENQNSLPLAGFYSMSTKKAVSVQQMSVKGVGAPNDSMLYKTSTLTQIYLPFRSTTNTTSFRFTHTSTVTPGPDGTGDPINVEVSDVVTFTYNSEPWFASEECGAMYRYRITSVSHTTNMIDSVGITDSLITNFDIEKIRLYMHDEPANEGEGGQEGGGQ